MAYTDDVLAATPLRYWPLNETSGTNANELVANEDATAFGMVMGGADGPEGIGGKAPVFTGVTTEYIKLRAAKILGGLNAWSVGMWTRLTMTSGSDAAVRSFYSEKGSSGNDLIRCSLGGVSFSAQQYFGYGSDASNFTINSGATYIVSSWHFVVFTRSGSSYATWYDVGRRMVGTNFASANTWTNTGIEARIGANVGATNPWLGRVAHLMLFDRVLSEADQKTLYEAGSPFQRELTNRNWWSATSPWRQRLDDVDNPPTIASNSADLVTKLVAQAGLSAPTAAAAQPLFVAEDDTVTQIVRIQGGQENPSTDKPHLWDALQVVPIPDEFLPDTANTDKGATIWNKDTDEYWDFWVMEHALKGPGWVTAATVTDTSGTLTAGTYGIYVAAVAEDDGIGNFKGLTSANTNGTNPPYTSDGSHAVRIVWDPVEGADGYNIYISATNSGFATARFVATVASNVVTYTYTGGVPDTGAALMTAVPIGVTTDWGCNYGGYIDGTDTNPGIFLPPRSNWGATATSLPNWAGTISITEALAAREGDVDAIDHAVHGALLQSTDTHVFPAQRHDYFGGPYGIPEGTRFQLNPAFDVMTIANPFVRAVARAYQTYGYIIRDHSGGFAAAPVENANALGRNPYPYIYSGAQGYEIFTGFPWSQMRVIDPAWTQEQSVGDPEPLAKIGTLTDDFEAPINTAKWTASGGTTLSGGRIHVPCGAGIYGGLTSVDSYDFTDSFISFQVSQLPQGNGADQAGFRLISDANPTSCRIYMWVEAGSAIFAEYVNSSLTLVRLGDFAGGITYDSVAHAFWRMRHSAGTIYWDFSATGETWTNWKTLSWAASGWPASALQSVKAQFVAGNYNSVAGRPDLIIDNVNTVAVSPSLDEVLMSPPTDVRVRDLLDRKTHVLDITALAANDYTLAAGQFGLEHIDMLIGPSNMTDITYLSSGTSVQFHVEPVDGGTVPFTMRVMAIGT